MAVAAPVTPLKHPLRSPVLIDRCWRLTSAQTGTAVSERWHCCLCQSSTRLAGRDVLEGMFATALDGRKSAVPVQHRFRIALLRRLTPEPLIPVGAMVASSPSWDWQGTLWGAKFGQSAAELTNVKPLMCSKMLRLGTEVYCCAMYQMDFIMIARAAVTSRHNTLLAGTSITALLSPAVHTCVSEQTNCTLIIEQKGFE